LNLKVKTKLPLDLGKMHFVGIGGIGMSGIAEIIYNLGYKVSGSDLKNTPIINRLIKMGIDVKIGHDSKNIDAAEIIVISSAIDSKNLELKEARRKKNSSYTKV
jgi:UDP-N-acetylmuramate--alanine ligase